jgi:hypothetical protein
MIIATWDAFARPGEVNFYQYSDWTYDYLLNCVDTLHKEKKTMKRTTMPRIADELFYFDFYFAMGAFWMCEDGLFCTEEQKENKRR